MKSLLIFLCLVVCFGTISNAQNLVPNPSFEEYLECPFSAAEFESQVVDWYSWQSTPDYFNTCNNDDSGLVGVPENALGFQYPISGNAYAGLYTYTYFAPDIREYIAVPLLQDLEIGQEYYVMFHASMYNGGIEIESLCATNHIGARFFTNPNFDGELNVLEPDNFSHIDYSTILSDSVNWTRIDGKFVADEGYNWLAIGNFYDGDNTEILVLNEDDRCFGIYYIENVCVATDPAFCEYLLSTEERQIFSSIKIFPNPADESITLISQMHPISSIILYDLNGKAIYQASFNNLLEVELDVSSYPSGVYFLRINSNEIFYNEKLILK